jgi:hypothetical protein
MLANLNPNLDAKDLAILAGIVETMAAKEGPRVGDFIRFACGTERRIGADWGRGLGVQTAKGGRFCIDRGMADHSGGYFGINEKAALTDTGETQPGEAWFFHHGEVRAHNGVDVLAPFRIFTSTEKAAR